MSTDEHSLEPAEVEAGLDELEKSPPPEIFQRRLVLRRRLSVLLLNMLTVVLLGVAFSPFDCWYLAYIALVPWMMSISPQSNKRWTIFCGWLAGLGFWAGCLYWLSWVTTIGYVASVFYLSIYWLVATIVMRAAIRRNLPIWIVLPIVWVSLEYIRAHVIGFPWFYLAHTQYDQTRLIQVCDVTGQYGLSFFIAMVNGAIIDLLGSPLFSRKHRGPALAKRIITGAVVSGLVVTALLAYGSWRLSQQRTSSGPAIGVVQHAFPLSLDKPIATPEKILADHIRSSRRFTGTGCDLVIWPESSLPYGLNANFIDAMLDADNKKCREFGKTKKRQAQRLASLSRQLGCPILAGGSTWHINNDATDSDNFRKTRNSALWFDGSWRQAGRYDKIQLVPFSECVPFKKSLPRFHEFLRNFVPQVMPQIEPGEKNDPFVLTRGGKTYNIVCTICFEGTFAKYCRKIIIKDSKKLANAVLVNLSNDGWFIWQRNNRQYRSTEHAQHLVHYYFRAVENRVPVVRAVNTGISAYIDSNGRLQSVVQHSGMRTMVSGTLLLADGDTGGGEILVDDRLTLYSQLGDVFAAAVSLAAVILTVILILTRPSKDSEIA